MGELSPGNTKRRWLPDGGEKKLRDQIHRESKFADDYKNLPFTFSKPRRVGRQCLFRCCECGHVFMAPKNTVMIICSNCKKSSLVELLDDD